MAVVADTSRSPHARLTAVDIEAVSLKDGFWGPRIAVNRTRSIPHQHAEAERTGRIDNFRRAAGRQELRFSGHLAPDSDVYKWMEGAAYSLAAHPDPELERALDALVELVRAAQDANGYLNTEFIEEKKGDRWKDLGRGHELYCGGHLVQAAIAHHRATGRTDLLDAAVKWADHVWRRFGPDGAEGTGGHPEVEMALVELWRETGERRYLDLAQRLVDRRGTPASRLGGSPQLQDHRPVREQVSPAGHAVRQLYLLCALADLYAETGEAALLSVLEEQWRNFTEKKMAVTGGAGARYQGEAFGADYELPNRTGYYETCAAVAAFLWNWRMLLVTAEARYADLMEIVLYNGLLAGVSLEGTDYFYTNPLEHDGGEPLARDRGSACRTTRHWDRVPCCPPNVARTLASLGGCVYGRAREREAVYVHLYAAGSAALDLAGTRLVLRQRTEYPWRGRIEILVEPEAEARFSLVLRIPGWAAGARAAINGEDVSGVEPGSYLEIARTWRSGDAVALDLPMPVRRLRAHPRASECAGCLALARGPVVYCIEKADHPGLHPFAITLPREAPLEARFEPGLLGGVVTLRGRARLGQGNYRLYSEDEARPPESEIDLVAIPYFAWANRARGAMRVWIPTG